MDGFADIGAARERAQAIFAAVSGAQLAARGRGELSLFDAIVESYRRTGLIPGPD